MLFDIYQSNILFDPPSRIMTIKTKINQGDIIKLKGFGSVKETIKKKKRQLTEREKIFVNNATNKGLISKIYKQLTKLNSKKKKKKTKKKQPKRKMVRRPK